MSDSDITRLIYFSEITNSIYEKIKDGRIRTSSNGTSVVKVFHDKHLRNRPVVRKEKKDILPVLDQHHNVPLVTDDGYY
jgi:hypothetical protein